jgi:hypothetical protein
LNPDCLAGGGAAGCSASLVIECGPDLLSYTVASTCQFGCVDAGCTGGCQPNALACGAGFDDGGRASYTRCGLDGQHHDPGACPTNTNECLPEEAGAVMCCLLYDGGLFNCVDKSPRDD